MINNFSAEHFNDAAAKKVRSFFEGRKMVVATRHHKEKVLAPLMNAILGVECVVPENFDTDVLGTFTGEVERRDDPVATLRSKCLMAMENYNFDLGIASEGSFGPHPNLFFVNADEEWVLLMDKKNNLEILAKELTTETNFGGAYINSEKELIDFAQQSLFPSHALILRNEKNSNLEIIKGISDWESLLKSYKKLALTYGGAFAETDMRALYNPTRMKVIETAAKNLILKIFRYSPRCHSPGFDILEQKKGLPCAWCGNPTDSILSQIYQCRHCSYSMIKTYPYGKQKEDPMYCNFCNP